MTDPDLRRKERRSNLRYEVQGTVARILADLAGDPAIANELRSEHVNAADMINDLTADESVLDRAYGRYAAVIEEQQRVELHRKVKPPLWMSGWRPTPAQWGSLVFGACLLIAGVVADLYFRQPVLLVLGIVVALLTVYWWGIPDVTHDLIAWSLKYVRLSFRRARQTYATENEIRDLLRPDVYEWINGMRSPSYSTVLTIRNASGLQVPTGETPFVRTRAADRFIHEINRPGQGAVGIAGRRGVGKTTLIERAVNNEFTKAGRDRLTILTSAPVRYDARDYVLHLHASACRAVLDYLRVRRYDSLSFDHLWQRVQRRERRKRSLGLTLVDLAKVLGLAGAALICLYTAHELNHPTIGDIWHDLTAGYQEFFTIAQKGLPTTFMWSLFANLIVDVLVLLIAWNMLVLVSGILRRLAFEPDEGVSTESLRRLFRRLSTGSVAPRTTIAQRSVAPFAEQELRRIRYLQTRTTGWSGTVNPMSVFGINPSRSLQRAEQALTHPEVVQAFRNFLTRVVAALCPSTIDGIIFAIDELDKISDPADAERFINEIKGIFGVAECTFIVSVSEDALASFEGRGVPLRDSFDSAFSTMIYVEPFTIDESRTWLARRAIGIPEPFVCLCHCLSGGMPRDLRRTAIALHDIYADHLTGRKAEPSLEQVVGTLIDDDIATRLRAFATAAGRLQDVGGSELVTMLNMVGPPMSSRQMIRLCSRLVPSDEQANGELDRLRLDIACYLYFCATVMTAFTNRLDPPALTEACGRGGQLGGSIETLARARQHMALDRRLSWQLITAFRVQWRLREIPMVRQATPPTAAT